MMQTLLGAIIVALVVYVIGIIIGRLIFGGSENA
jgi:hypothetical protein